MQQPGQVSSTAEKSARSLAGPDENSTVLCDLLVRHSAPYLQELLDSREEGWRQEGLDAAFVQQRATADKADANTVRFFTTKMTEVLGEIDQRFHVVDEQDPGFTFLDIGCASGGFTHYVLTRSREIKGAGISLPTDEGGHPWMLPYYLDRQFELVWHNLLAYHLGPPTSPQADCLPPLPFDDKQFNLVLLDGHHLRTQTDNEHTRDSDGPRLFWGQLQIGLRRVADGGTIVMKLHKAESVDTARALYILDQVSSKMYTHKPRAIHVSRNSYYVVAKGVRRDRLLDYYVAALQNLWHDLTYGGEDGRGAFRPRAMILEDVIPWDVLTSEQNLNRLIELGEDVWKTQLEALIRQNKKYKHTQRPAGTPDLRNRIFRQRVGNA